MSYKSHFKFNKQERSGIFFLLLIIILLQIGYFVFRSFPMEKSVASFSADMQLQAQIDVLKENALRKDSIKIYPFNPNFITDYKGYTLGMSVEEIDRLHAFRARDEYVNTPEDFQKVTQVSDSLLKTIAPYFKFPDWTKKRRQYATKNNNQAKSKKQAFEIKDLNVVSAEELKAINGIGEKLSARIIKFRDRLGGFLVDEQLYDVYGLEPEVVERTLKRFKVLNPPQIEKININTASVEMLTKLIYLQRKVANNIVSYRDSEGSIDSFAELSKIEDFPTEKIDRIALYLSL
ncbi:ComEA family DNA-binding protein [Maribacter sp. 2308TA10-17]|uniref:ComEA family DNA-binding protein n=1 Tax=Maribacter sp. 2308TA10-17 TaxID=3386276 RepID=UPI0039BCE41D